MLHYVFFTYSGECAGLALRLWESGHPVLFAILENGRDIKTATESKGDEEDVEEHKRRISTLEGMVPRAWAWDTVMALHKVPEAERNNYFIFCDMNHLWRVGEELKGLGFPGLYPTENDRVLEVDRDHAKRFVESHYPDLRITETQEFKTTEEARAFLDREGEVFVLKGLDEDAETFVPESSLPILAKMEMVFQFEEGKKQYEKSGFILERKIPRVIEITPEVTFWNGEPLYATVDIELKRKGAGDVGKLVGCAADLVFPVPLDSKIIRMILPDEMRKIAKTHRGLFVIDASLLFDPEIDEAYFGEFCFNRKGWNAFYTELALLPDPNVWFEDVVRGKNPLESAVPCAVSVRVFNDNLDKDQKGKAAAGIPMFYDNETSRHLWLLDVKSVGQKTDRLFGSAGYGHDLAVVTGAGRTIQEAARDCYVALEGDGESTTGFVFKKKTYRPKHDFLSRDYPGNILDRYEYGVKLGLYPDLGLSK